MQKRVICSWARTAKTDKERDIFLQMARAWLDAAARMRAYPTAQCSECSLARR
jgi:hypothetical protein